MNIRDEHINTLSTLLAYGRRIKNKAIAEASFDAFKSYCEASTDPQLQSSYLKYWICIEKCLLKKQKITGTEIIATIKKMPFWKDPRLRYQVNKLLDHRNIYVHRLDENITQVDRNLVKLISEGFLDFLLYNAHRFNNKKELEMFYTFIQKDNQNLITIQKSLANQNKIINLTMNIRGFYKKLP